jgi:hypothetical protein
MAGLEPNDYSKSGMAYIYPRPTELDRLRLEVAALKKRAMAAEAEVFRLRNQQRCR